MNSSLSPHQHHKDITILFLKHAPQAGGTCSMMELMQDLKSLGNTFVRCAQMAACQGNLMPRKYSEALSRLGVDRASDFEAESPEVIEAIVEEELGKKLSHVFAHFCPTPYAFASAGQIHRATLHTGRDVSVKVQRPDIRRRIVDDLKNLADIAAFLDGNRFGGAKGKFGKMVEQFRINMIRELDYQREAEHFALLGRHLNNYPKVHIPVVLEDFTTSRVLTTDLLDGTSIGHSETFLDDSVDREALAEELIQSYLDQILVSGVFHADPHAENVWVTRDHLLTFSEVPCAISTPHAIRRPLVHLLTGICKGESLRIADAALSLAETAATEELDRSSLFQDISRLIDSEHSIALGNASIGSRLLEIIHVCQALGLTMPDEISIIARALGQVSELAEMLCRTFDANESIRWHLEAFAHDDKNEPIPFPSPLSRVV